MPAAPVAQGPVITAPYMLPTAEKDWNVKSFGAGQNKPRYNDRQVRFWFSCYKDTARFRVTGASIVMWSNGVKADRIEGFHFKYRLVPRGTEGRLQLASKWSTNRSVSFKKAKKAKSYRKVSQWMNAPALKDTHSSAAAWDLEIKLKYVRPLRVDYTYKYRIAINTPQCGLLAE